MFMPCDEPNEAANFELQFLFGRMFLIEHVESYSFTCVFCFEFVDRSRQRLNDLVILGVNLGVGLKPAESLIRSSIEMIILQKLVLAIGLDDVVHLLVRGSCSLGDQVRRSTSVSSILDPIPIQFLSLKTRIWEFESFETTEEHGVLIETRHFLVFPDFEVSSRKMK